MHNCDKQECHITGGSHLSQIFWEHENLSGLSVLIYMSHGPVGFWQKIWAKLESGLTAEWLKWNPPVLSLWVVCGIIVISKSNHNFALYKRLFSGDLWNKYDQYEYHRIVRRVRYFRLQIKVFIHNISPRDS